MSIYQRRHVPALLVILLPALLHPLLLTLPLHRVHAVLHRLGLAHVDVLGLALLPLLSLALSLRLHATLFNILCLTLRPGCGLTHST